MNHILWLARPPLSLATNSLFSEEDGCHGQDQHSRLICTSWILSSATGQRSTQREIFHPHDTFTAYVRSATRSLCAMAVCRQQHPLPISPPRYCKAHQQMRNPRWLSCRTSTSTMQPHGPGCTLERMMRPKVAMPTAQQYCHRLLSLVQLELL